MSAFDRQGDDFEQEHPLAYAAAMVGLLLALVVIGWLVVGLTA